MERKKIERENKLNKIIIFINPLEIGFFFGFFNENSLIYALNILGPLIPNLIKFSGKCGKTRKFFQKISSGIPRKQLTLRYYRVTARASQINLKINLFIPVRHGIVVDNGLSVERVLSINPATRTHLLMCSYNVVAVVVIVVIIIVICTLGCASNSTRITIQTA